MIRTLFRTPLVRHMSSSKKAIDSALKKAFPNGEITATPKDRSEWREWLAENHADKKFEQGGMWLIYFKKEKKPEEDRPTLNYAESVEEALCFGWIDGTKRKVDVERWSQYFRPRKVKSEWSRVNKKRVEELEKQGLMTDAGRAVIERAKKDGSWSKIDHVEDLIVPDDLRKALKEHEAEEFFDNLRKSPRKMALHWLSTAKREETRANRMQQIVENAGQGRSYAGGGSFKELKARSTSSKGKKKATVSGRKGKRNDDESESE
jgi:uncharacterized protein YdeI (YjbR/CyaY-like superfamily)